MQGRRVTSAQGSEAVGEKAKPKDGRGRVISSSALLKSARKMSRNAAL